MTDLPPVPEFDPKQAYQAIKSHEGMVAFTGFELADIAGHPSQGILKISDLKTPYSGDILTLTFIIDLESRVGQKRELADHFDTLREIPTGILGSDFERLNLTRLDRIKEMPDWFVVEVQLFYKQPVGQIKTLIEKDLLPPLEGQLDAKFEPLEWWPQDRATLVDQYMPEWSHSSGWKPLRSLLEWWQSPAKS